MAEAKVKGGKKGRKIGRQAHHPSHVNYTRGNVCAKNKAKRVYQSSGPSAFKIYCAAHDLAMVTLTRIGKRSVEIKIKNIVK